VKYRDAVIILCDHQTAFPVGEGLVFTVDRKIKATNISELAAEVLTHFKRGDLETPGIGRIFIHADDCPQWIIDMCHDAHGDMMPDDWRYEFIGDALTSLSDESVDSDESFGEWLDNAYIHYHEHLAWLSSRNDRMYYCDDAVKEYGMESSNMDTRIKLGMDTELREVFAIVRDALQEHLDNHDYDE